MSECNFNIRLFSFLFIYLLDEHVIVGTFPVYLLHNDNNSLFSVNHEY